MVKSTITCDGCGNLIKTPYVQTQYYLMKEGKIDGYVEVEGKSEKDDTIDLCFSCFEIITSHLNHWGTKKRG